MTSFCALGCATSLRYDDDRNERHANRDHMEDAAEVVGGRVVGTLVVVVVETVELRDHHPCRKREQERENLLQR